MRNKTFDPSQSIRLTSEIVRITAERDALQESHACLLAAAKWAVGFVSLEIAQLNLASAISEAEKVSKP